jgi:hypothetical protein
VEKGEGKTGRRKKKKEKGRASVLLLPFKYDLVRMLVGNTLPV